MTWTHVICDDCWAKREPNRTPFRLKECPDEWCCFCGVKIPGGDHIFVREDPNNLTCIHPES